VRLAGWSTPRAQERQQRNSHDAGEAMSRQVHGVISSGSPASTARRGQLNPAFARWLMGFPEAWDRAAIQAFRLRRSTRPRKPDGCD
jgi:hypothetical protein